MKRCSRLAAGEIRVSVLSYASCSVMCILTRFVHGINSGLGVFHELLAVTLAGGR